MFLTKDKKVILNQLFIEFEDNAGGIKEEYLNTILVSHGFSHPLLTKVEYPTPVGPPIVSFSIALSFVIDIKSKKTVKMLKENHK